MSGPFRGLFDRQTDVRLDRPFVLFDVQDLYGDDRCPTASARPSSAWSRPTSGAPCAGSAGPASSSPTRPPPCWSTRTRRGSSATWPAAAASTGSALCVAVQRLDHLRTSPAGLDVLANAGATFLLGHRSEDVGLAVDAFKLSEADRTDLVTRLGAPASSSPGPGGPSWRCWPAPRSTGYTPPAPTKVAALEAEERAGPRRPRHGRAPAALAPGRGGCRWRGVTGTRPPPLAGPTGGCTPASGWRPFSGPWPPGYRCSSVLAVALPLRALWGP